MSRSDFEEKTMKQKYAVYVSDPNGWDEDCQGFQDVFFGSCDDGDDRTYVHPCDGGMSDCGHVEVTGYRAARAELQRLRTTGDWVVDTKESRPSYAIAKLKSSRRRR